MRRDLQYAFIIFVLCTGRLESRQGAGHCFFLLLGFYVGDGGLLISTFKVQHNLVQFRLLGGVSVVAFCGE